MSNKKVALTSLVLVFLLTFSLTGTFAQEDDVVELKFWHAMSGGRLEPVNTLVERFNESHPNIHVEATFSGTYEETLNKAVTAAKAGNPPNIIQSYEVGTQIMWDSPYIVPIGDLAEPGEVDWGDYLNVIKTCLKRQV
jgi:sn-glycerol 3-phosphate transport system substrate-binding protein